MNNPSWELDFYLFYSILNLTCNLKTYDKVGVCIIYLFIFYTSKRIIYWNEGLLKGVSILKK